MNGLNECPECGYESPFWHQVFLKSSPCLVCGFDMGGVEFESEASAEFVVVTNE